MICSISTTRLRLRIYHNYSFFLFFMSDVNSVWLEGKVFGDAKAIGDWGLITFQLGTSSSYTKKDGTIVYENCYHSCSAQGKAGEVAADIKDGMRVRVRGAIKQDKVEKDGKKTTYHKIKVLGIDILGGASTEQDNEDLSSAEVKKAPRKTGQRTRGATQFPQTDEQKLAQEQRNIEAKAKMRAAQDDISIEDVPF